MKNTFALVLLAAALLSGCMSEEEKTKGARYQALQAEQGAIIEASGGKCDVGERELNAWYAKNKAEVDELSGWHNTLSSSKVKKIEEANPNPHFKALIGQIIRCGFVPLNNERTREQRDKAMAARKESR